MNSLWLAPHSDDETLFGAFTLMKRKPLVVIVTDSYIQKNRGENITADQRWQESVEAMKLLGCSVIRLGIRDDVIDEWSVRERFKEFENFSQVFAPAIQGGNVHHDIVGKVALELFGKKCKQYTTYSRDSLYTTGKESVKGDLELKNKALDCYQSQINLSATRPHFEAVRNRLEWFI